MINSVSQNPSFGSKCIVILPKNTDLTKLFEKVNKTNPNFNLRFVEPSLNMTKLAEDEFTYVGKSNIKNSQMAKFIFEDGNTCDSQYSFQLPAFLRWVFNDESKSKVVRIN